MCDQHYSFDLQPDIKSQRPKHTICGVDLFGVIVYYNRMFHMTTVSLIARVDMQDAMQGFIHNKSFPELSMSLCGQHTEHRFEENHEQHRFTITASLDTGPHDLTLELLSRSTIQGAVEVTDLEVQGTPMGMRIYQGEYTAFGSEQTYHGHVYMGWPGRWKYTLHAPMERRNIDVGLQ